MARAAIVLASPLAAPRGERSGATTLPLRPPCHFTRSPLHVHPPPAVGERVKWHSPSRDGRGAASLTRHHPERVRRTGESASRQLQVNASVSQRRSGATVAPLIRRFASARSRLRRRRSHPSILQGTLLVGRAVTSAHFHRRHAGCRSRVIAPHSSRQPACRPPGATISSCAGAQHAKRLA